MGPVPAAFHVSSDRVSVIVSPPLTTSSSSGVDDTSVPPMVAVTGACAVMLNVLPTPSGSPPVRTADGKVQLTVSSVAIE